MAMNKTCPYCKNKFARRESQTVAAFHATKFCSSKCRHDNYNHGRLLIRDKLREFRKRDFYLVCKMPMVEQYDKVDNRIYHQQLSEITGLSRMYLDGEVNLDTLRIMEIEMKAA